MKNLGSRPGGLLVLIQSIVVIVSFFLADAQGQDIVTNDTSELMKERKDHHDLGQHEEAIGYYDKVLARY